MIKELTNADLNDIKVISENDLWVEYFKRITAKGNDGPRRLDNIALGTNKANRHRTVEWELKTTDARSIEKVNFDFYPDWDCTWFGSSAQLRRIQEEKDRLFSNYDDLGAEVINKLYGIIKSINKEGSKVELRIAAPTRFTLYQIAVGMEVIMREVSAQDICSPAETPEKEFLTNASNVLYEGITNINKEYHLKSYVQAPTTREVFSSSRIELRIVFYPELSPGDNSVIVTPFLNITRALSNKRASQIYNENMIGGCDIETNSESPPRLSDMSPLTYSVIHGKDKCVLLFDPYLASIEEAAANV